MIIKSTNQGNAISNMQKAKEVAKSNRKSEIYYFERGEMKAVKRFQENVPSFKPKNNQLWVFIEGVEIVFEFDNPSLVEGER